jgi:hypothetical protein
MKKNKYPKEIQEAAKSAVFGNETQSRWFKILRATEVALEEIKLQELQLEAVLERAKRELRGVKGLDLTSGKKRF